jgi:squalene synthase HpnC
VSTIETPSGKDAAYENFPVGSWLLPAAIRPHVAAFYRYARAIDDIADSNALSADEKVARLTAFEQVLKDPAADRPGLETATRMRTSLAETGTTPQHCLDLITAFKQDAVKTRYRHWDDLMGYCILSAAPVGRYLIDLHGGSRDGYGPSDALCNALQVINHLQDCKDDYLTLDRVYLPQDWMAEAGAKVEDLDATASTPALRRVIDRCLDATGGLMPDARRLPAGLASRRLAMESAGIIEIARRLIVALRRRDPLGPRVALTKPEYLLSVLTGIAQVLMRSR